MKETKLIRRQRARARLALLAIFASMMAAGRTASALTINLAFDPDANFTAAGLNAQSIIDMKAACSYAATQFTSRYTDPINVNIKVTATAGTSDFGSSTTFFDSVSSYNNLRAAFAGDSKSADDATTVDNGGSLQAGADPVATAHTHNVARAQAKALGLRTDDMLNDGTFNFGGGQPWTYDPNNRKVAGKFDFIGVAIHEFSEIMGRTSVMGDTLGTGTPQYCAFDLFHYTGAGTRGLNTGPGRSFSFNNGTTLLIAFNDGGNGGDPQDWAGPAPDPFNAFGPPNEQDDLTAVDLQTMDVIGYDRGAAVLANISTRLPVGTDPNALFAGFIVTGNVNKKVIIRAIGPSLKVNGAPLAGRLQDPILELHDSSVTLETNDNWGDSPNKQAIIDSTVAPSDSLESAIVRSLPPGTYTAIERGVNNATGIGVVEMYDLDTAANARLVNISTRGFVQTGNDVLFAGMAVVGPGSQKVIVRALGPSINVPGKMADPTMELHDGNGGLLETNDNWVDSPNKQQIIDSTVAPPNNLESAIIRTLTAGSYTAIVRGVSNGTGIAVVEVYALN
jgi:hypothetical protein